MTFPIRPRHIQGEPACSYVLRMAEANGYSWRSDSLASLGISMSGLARGDTKALVPILGADFVEHIDRYTPLCTDAGCVRLNGEMLEPAQLFYQRRRFCVACWADDVAVGATGTIPRQHLRCWWSIAAISACPVHNLRLCDRCPQCEHNIRFAGGRPTVCHCGANLTRASRIAVDPETLAAEVYVVGRLGGLPRASDPILDTFSLGDAINLMQRLGCCLSAGRDVRFGRVAPENRPAMMLAGFRAIQTSINGVEAAIEALLAAPGKQDQLPVQLGQFYHWFASLPKGPLHDWIAARISNVVKRMQISWQGWELHVAEPPTPHRISASGAKVCLDAGWDRAITILTAAGLRQDDMDRCRPTVDRREVEALAGHLGRLVGVDGVADVLGVAPRSVRMLAAAGIIPCDPLAGSAFRYPKFDPQVVEGILDRLATGAPITSLPPVGSVSIAAASRPVGIVALCRAILEGRIAVIARVEGEEGLRGIRVQSSGLKELTTSYDGPWMGLIEAGRVLGMRRNGLALIVTAGHIGSMKSPQLRLLSRKDVELFRARYVSANELARSRKTSVKAILSKLAAVGCAPAIELAAHGCVEVRLFERDVTDRLPEVIAST